MSQFVPKECPWQRFEKWWCVGRPPDVRNPTREPIGARLSAAPLSMWGSNHARRVASILDRVWLN
ncbi:MAG: hypothetical protein JSU09_03185 [Bacteroidetes bacterium]|nr:hypothetical protein [Bacteroidota bacterium]